MRGRSALNTMHSVPCEQWRGMRALLLLLVLASPASAVPLPLVCDLTSEEDPAFVIRLNKRTRTALRGVLTHQSKTLGAMSSSKPNQLRQSIWSFQSGDITHSGTAVLFADNKAWNPLQTSSQTSGDEPRPVRWPRQRSPFVETQTPKVFI